MLKIERVAMFSNIVIEEKGKKIQFDLHNVDLAFANSMRRVILKDIPNVAFGNSNSSQTNTEEPYDITFITNTTALHNEQMGHRISLVPVCLSDSEIDDVTRGSTSGPTSLLSRRFTLNVENKDSHEPIVVTTRDIVIDGEDNNNLRNRWLPPDDITKDHIILTKLKKGEHIHAEFGIVLGTAGQHARWCPVSNSVYYNILDKDEVEKQKKKIKDDDMNKFETLDKWRLFTKNKYGEPDGFHFTVDSECGMTSKYLVNKSFDILIGKLERLLKPGVFQVEVIDLATMMYAIYADNDDHTIGNLLMSSTYNTLVREKREQDDGSQILAYIGYYQPHPLETRIVYKVRFLKMVDPIAFMQGSARATISVIEKMKREWLKLTEQKIKK